MNDNEMFEMVETENENTEMEPVKGVSTGAILAMGAVGGAIAIGAVKGAKWIGQKAVCLAKKFAEKHPDEETIDGEVVENQENDKVVDIKEANK